MTPNEAAFDLTDALTKGVTVTAGQIDLLLAHCDEATIAAIGGLAYAAQMRLARLEKTCRAMLNPPKPNVTHVDFKRGKR